MIIGVGAFTQHIDECLFEGHSAIAFGYDVYNSFMILDVHFTRMMKCTAENIHKLAMKSMKPLTDAGAICLGTMCMFLFVFLFLLIYYFVFNIYYNYVKYIIQQIVVQQ